MIKVGMIGCGAMGNFHGPELMKLPNVTVVGTCDVIEGKAKVLADKIGIDRYCTDFRELLDDVDAVWVCTEPFNRAKIVIPAAQAGKHVFTEKPIARSLKDAEDMVAATSKAKVKYMLGYCLRFWQPYRLLHDTFASGELGDLVSCYMRRNMCWDPTGTWYSIQENSGGVSLDFGSHDVDWLRWVGGDVKTVFGRVQKIRKSYNVDDHGTGMFVYEKGGVASIEDSWMSHVCDGTFGIIGTKGTMMVSGDGKVRKRVGYEGDTQTVDIEAAMAIDPKGNLGKRDESGKIQKITVKNENIQQHFFRAIEEDIVPLTNGADGLKTLKTIMALWESSNTGKAVNVADIK